MTKPEEIESMEARREILNRIRSLQGRTPHGKNEERRQATLFTQLHQSGPQPDLLGDVTELFIEKAKGMLCTIDQVSDFSQVPSRVAEFLNELGLSSSVSIWPSLKALDWSVLERDFKFGAPSGDDLVGVSAVAGAIAETGTLVFASRPDEPASTHLLPETHIAVVRTDQITHTMEQAIARLRSLDRLMPRALNFVSGPSRTADIEQTIVLGAHGPYRVHLILVN